MSKPKPVSEPQAATPAERVKRPRGRPPRLSERAIIEKTMELLNVHSADDISMAMVADSLSIPTMSLYNYFANHAALLNAVSDYAFSLFKFPSSQLQKPWQEAVMAWLWALQHHLDRHPVAIKIVSIEGQASLAWNRVMAPLMQVLKGLGLQGQALAFAAAWFTSETIGLMMIESSAHASRQVYALREVFAELDAEEHADHLLLKKHIGKIKRDDVLNFGFRSAIRALEQLIPPSV
jgi:AcrR family transcriptional regulator